MFTRGPKIFLGCPGGHLADLILCKLRLCSPAGQESVSPCDLILMIGPISNLKLARDFPAVTVFAALCLVEAVPVAVG